MKRCLIFALGAALTVAANAQEAITIDWEKDAIGNAMKAGQFIDNEFVPWGVKISAHNFSGPNSAIIFDSHNPTGGDNDLRTAGYGPGNTKPLGNLLIIAENVRDANGDGYVDNPDDEGDQPSGWVKFEYDQELKSGYIRLVDIEENGGTLKFYRDGSLVKTMNIMAKGDNSVQMMNWDGFVYDTMQVSLAGSGALDTVHAETVPEPGTMIALAGGFGLLAARRRKKKATA